MSNPITYTKLAVAPQEIVTIVLATDTDIDEVAAPHVIREINHIEGYIDVSANPAAGTMDVRVRPRGSAKFRSLKSDIPLVDGPRDYEFDVTDIDAIQYEDTGFDAGKTMDIYLKCRSV